MIKKKHPGKQSKDLDAKYRAQAKEQYHVDGEIEIDSDAKVSSSEEGAYVAAWVWVDAKEES